MSVVGIDAECMNTIDQAKRDAYNDVLDGKEPQQINNTVYMQSYRFYRSVSNEHDDRFGDRISDGDME